MKICLICVAKVSVHRKVTLQLQDVTRGNRSQICLRGRQSSPVGRCRKANNLMSKQPAGAILWIMASYLSLDSLLGVCKQLETLLEKSFGPLSLKSLICTSTGKVLVTSDGATVLKSVNLCHPIGQLVTKAALCHHSVCGDGTKTFVFLLTDVISALLRNKKLSVDSNSPHKATDRQALVRSFNHLKHIILTTIETDLVSMGCINITDLYVASFEETYQTLEVIIRTTLHGRYSMSITRHLAALLSQLVFNAYDLPLTQLKERIYFVYKDFSTIALQNPGSSPMASQLMPGFIIQRDFLSNPISNEHPISLVLMSFSLEDAGSNHAVFTSSSTEGLTQVLEWKDKLIDKIVNHFRRIRINLILSTDRVGESFLFACNQCGISVIHCIDEDESNRLQRVCNIHPLHTLNSLLEAAPDVDVGHAEKCQSVIVGGRKCVWLQGFQKIPRDRGSFALPICQLLISGMTEGICGQICSDLQCALQAAHIWLDQHHLLDDLHQKSSNSAYDNKSFAIKSCSNRFIHQDHIESIGTPASSNHRSVAVSTPSGGAFEIWLSHKLEIIYNEHKDVALKVVISSVKEALLRIPLRLAQNSFSSATKYVDIMKTASFNNRCYVNGRSGEICMLTESDLTDVVGLEPVAAKKMLVCHVLGLLEQLLRLDMTVHVPSIRVHDDDDDVRGDDSIEV